MSERMTLHVFHAYEVGPGQEPGWFYAYTRDNADPLESTWTQEHGPFASKGEALADARAGQPAQWDVFTTKVEEEPALSGWPRFDDSSERLRAKLNARFDRIDALLEELIRRYP
jgi:hypothetical protein